MPRYEFDGANSRADHYRPEIDGLRAIAVLAVMFYHADFPWFTGGYTGVDIFFVLSGYLITQIILREQAGGQFSLANFWIRRARRILPALILVMLASIPPAVYFMDPAELESFGASLSASTLFSANLYFWRSSGGYFALAVDRMPLIHLWSLAVEEQFYLLYPLILLILHRFARRWLLFAIAVGFFASLVLSQFASNHSPAANFFLLPTRAFELLAGALIAILEVRGLTHHFERRVNQNLLAIAGLALIVCPFFLLTEANQFPGLLALPTILGTCLLIRYARGKGISASLASPPLVGIGLISYSAYLLHQPILVFAKIISLNAIPIGGRAAILILALTLAAFSWRYVENPVRHGTLLASNRRAVLVSLALIAAIFTSGVYFWGSQGMPQRLTPQLQRLASLNKRFSDSMLPCFFAPGVNRDLSTACTRGPANAPVKIAILGDSHAAALAPAFDPLLKERNVRLVEFVAAGCPPVLQEEILSRYQKHCARFNKLVLNRIMVEKNITTVILSARWTYYIERSFFDNGEGGVEAGPRDDWPETRHEATSAAFKSTVNLLLAAGKRVVLVYPVPEPGWDVPRYLIQSYRLGMHRKFQPSTSFLRFRERNERAYQALDSIGFHTNLIRTFPARGLCNQIEPGRCSLVHKSVPLYFDDDHLTPAGGQLALKDTAEKLLRH